jgi:hypothetical protein
MNGSFLALELTRTDMSEVKQMPGSAGLVVMAFPEGVYFVWLSHYNGRGIHLVVYTVNAV